MNRTVAKLKKIGGSPLFLIAAIAYLVSLVATAIGSQSQATAMAAAAKSLLGDYYGTYADKIEMFGSAMPWAGIGSAVFGILVGIGMIMYFISCHSASSSSKGLTMIKVVKIFELIGVIAMLLAVLLVEGILIFTVLFGTNAASGSTPTWLIIAAVVVVVVTVLIFVFAIMYYLGIFKTIKSVKMTFSTGVIMGKVSLYVIICNYVLALSSLIGAIMTRDIVLMIARLTMCISLVTCSINMAMFRSEMRYISSRGGSAEE